jgi:hypothetical protein
MDKPKYQLIGRRPDRQETLLFRDRKGRHFIRPACGAKLVRVTARDAESIKRQYAYNSVLDGVWRTELDATGLECALPLADESTAILPEAFRD